VLRRREEVSRELLDEEPVKRLVAVARVDHIVAVAPGIAVGDVLVQAVGNRRSGPRPASAAPALAMLKRGQQPIDDPGKRAGESSARKASTSSGVGGRPVRSKRRPADQGRFVSSPARAASRSPPARQDEAVERRPGPGLIPDGGDRRVARRSERPERAPPFDVDPRPRRRPGLAGARVRGTHRHPLRQQCDLRSGSFALGRHLQIFILVEHGLDQQALARFAGLDCRPRSPPFRQPSVLSNRRPPRSFLACCEWHS